MILVSIPVSIYNHGQYTIIFQMKISWQHADEGNVISTEEETYIYIYIYIFII